MATNREQQVGHMTGFPPAVYPFAFNSMRSHSPFDLLANSSLFGRFGADLPKEMAALCDHRPQDDRRFTPFWKSIPPCIALFIFQPALATIQ
ncbi:retinoic acid receptor gamma isoform X1 [Lates japonicus]